jgi:hypothetical protein
MGAPRSRPWAFQVKVLLADGVEGIFLSSPECGFDSGSVQSFHGGQQIVDRGLGRPFEDPIKVNGRMLVTLRDAGGYIAGLPKAEHDAPEWQAAMER